MVVPRDNKGQNDPENPKDSEDPPNDQGQKDPNPPKDPPRGKTLRRSPPAGQGNKKESKKPSPKGVDQEADPEGKSPPFFRTANDRFRRDLAEQLEEIGDESNDSLENSRMEEANRLND